MRPLVTVAFVALCVSACSRPPVPFAQQQPRDRLYSGLVGQWHGTRVVADSSPAAGRVEATDLSVVPAPDRDGLELRYRTRAGTRSIEQSFGHWHFARGLEVAQLDEAGGQTARTFRVIEQSGGRNGAPLQLVLEAQGEAQGEATARPSRIRQQIDVSAGILRIRKDVQIGDGDFTFQEAFVFRRAE